MNRVIIVGCGVVGAAIAYELSQVSNLNITVIEKHAPAQAATSAALGVLMGAISGKIKGKAWQLRAASLQRYDKLIAELEANLTLKIPYNRQGILLLSVAEEDLSSWQKLAAIRQTQGYDLKIWDASQLGDRFPHLDLTRVQAGIYSPSDRQVDPVKLTLALVAAANRNGVNFQFGADVLAAEWPNAASGDRQCGTISTTVGEFAADWLIIAAGLGSFPLTAQLKQPIKIQPVLGQALHLRLDRPASEPQFQPVITGEDTHIVPLGKGEYWIGATVEFPAAQEEINPSAASLQAVLDKAISFYPQLAEATVLRTWSGLRPRPIGRPAPIIERLAGYNNVLVATGHYRNGILLAPATALAMREYICTDVQS